MGLEQFDTSKTYLTIVGGTLTQKVDKTTEGAKLREWETKDGKKGEKWELYYKSVNGFLTGIEFRKSDFGDQLALTIKDGDETYQLQMGLDGKYFTDFAKKISNIYLDMDIVLSPFDFEADGKRRTGLSIKQEGLKIQDWFWDPEAKKSINNFPHPDGDTKKFNSDDWKVYFITVKKFLKKHVEEVWGKQQVVEAKSQPAPEVAEPQPQDDF